jgi:hypothetical protein
MQKGTTRMTQPPHDSTAARKAVQSCPCNCSMPIMYSPGCICTQQVLPVNLLHACPQKTLLCHLAHSMYPLTCWMPDVSTVHS